MGLGILVVLVYVYFQEEKQHVPLYDYAEEDEEIKKINRAYKKCENARFCEEKCVSETMPVDKIDEIVSCSTQCFADVTVECEPKLTIDRKELDAFANKLTTTMVEQQKKVLAGEPASDIFLDLFDTEGFNGKIPMFLDEQQLQSYRYRLTAELSKPNLFSS